MPPYQPAGKTQQRPACLRPDRQSPARLRRQADRKHTGKQEKGAIIMQNVTLRVEGMSCNHCVNAIEKALKELGASGKVDLAAKTVEVSYDENALTLEAIKEAIEDQGYDVV
jgi:copper chaperone